MNTGQTCQEAVPIMTLRKSSVSLIQIDDNFVRQYASHHKKKITKACWVFSQVGQILIIISPARLTQCALLLNPWL